MNTAVQLRVEQVGRYHDHSRREHRVRVRQVGEQVWEIVDVTTAGSTVIDRLEGPEEDWSTARAVAVDWLSENRRNPTKWSGWGKQAAETT